MNPAASPLSADELQRISQGRSNKKVIIQQQIHTLNAEKGSVAALLQQALENGIDNGANRIDIMIKQDKNQFTIVNDGRGAEADDVAHLNSLGEQHVRPDQETTGKHNTGRLSYLAVADGGVDFFFRSKHFPVMHRLAFTRELANALMDDSKKVFNPPIAVPNEPDCWPKGLNTGTAVVLKGVRWKIVEEVSKIRAQLMRYLGPWTTRSVFLNGKPLPDHFPTGKTFPGTKDLGGDFGKIEYIFGEPQGKTKWIKLGGKNPLCTLEKFYDGVKDSRLLERVPLWMLESDKLAGFINIPFLNEKYAGPDRRSVTEDLYEDTAFIESIVNFLQKIGPELEEYFQLTQDDPQGNRNPDDDMAIIARLFPVEDSFFGRKKREKGPSGPKPEILLTPKEQILKPGVEFEIHLSRGRAGGTWTIPEGVGTIVDDQPRCIRVRAGEKIGSHKITYTYDKAKDAPKTGEMTLHISEEQTPSVHGPLHFPAPAHNRFNINGYDGEITQWKINSDEITFTGGNGTLKYVTMHVPRGCRPATYSVEVLGPGDVVIAQRNIWIEAPDNKFMSINGQHYLLEQPNIKGTQTFFFHPRRIDNGQMQYDGTLSINLMSPNAVDHRDKFGEGSAACELALMHMMCATYAKKFPNADFEKLIAEQLAKLPKPKTP